MEILRIKGGKKLMGTVEVPTAKNAVLPIIAASVMLDGESKILECPNLSDIKASVDIINSIRSSAILEDGSFYTSYRESKTNFIHQEDVLLELDRLTFI